MTECTCDRMAHPCDVHDTDTPEWWSPPSDAEVRALGRVIRDAGISGVTGDHVGAFDLARADAVLCSDWLTADRERVRRQTIAQVRRAIEAANASFGVSDDPYGGEYDRGVHQGLIEASRVVATLGGD